LSKYNFYKYFTLYFILFGIAISILGSFVSYALQVKDIHFDMAKKANEIFDIKTDSILKPFVKNMDNTVKSLGSNRTIKEFLKTRDEHVKNELEHIFLAVTTSQSIIMQTRLICKDGNELIRIEKDKNSDANIIVEKSKLQDKSGAYYFQKISQLKEESLWHSKIDLNEEYGELEIPYKSTMRFAMPIIVNGEFSGMVIINVSIENLFLAIGKSSAFEHFIIDKDGNYILHPDDNFSFNKYKSIKRDLNEDFENGLKAKGVYSFSLDSILENEDMATLVFKTKTSYKKSLFEKELNTIIIILVINIILSFIVAIYISKIPTNLQAALVKAHEKLNEFASIVDKYVITATTKPDSTILSVSSAFESSSGYTKDELVGKKMNILNNPQQNKIIFFELWRTILKGEAWSGIIKNRTKKGDTYWLEQNIVPTLDKDKKIESFVSVSVDITAKVELERLASIDKLTGAYNRRMIDEFMKKEVSLHVRDSKNLSLIMADIDHFKAVNDTYGHQAGDVVLSDVGRIISSAIRKSDIFGRYGGEEFIIICPNTSSEQALVLAEKIREEIESFSFAEVGHKTISLGISTLIANDKVENIIKRADDALYIAKNEGRNRAVVG